MGVSSIRAPIRMGSFYPHSFPRKVDKGARHPVQQSEHRPVPKREPHAHSEKMSKRFGLHVARSAGGERAKNTWSALESDSETEPEVETKTMTPPRKTRPQAPLAPKRQKTSPVECTLTLNLLNDDPVLTAMSNGDLLWGDLLTKDQVYEPVSSPSTPVEEPATLRGSETEFWSAPWAAKLGELVPDVYDTSKLSDVDFENMMAWLYDKGWWVGDFERSWVAFEPDNLPSRYWIAPADLTTGPIKVVHFGTCCGGHGHSHKKKAKSAETTQILRFCRSTPCTEEGCRYVHGDTIPRVDRPCAFGAACGATDPTGLKRSQCLYMHPGETWSAELVITRPVAPATVVAAPPAESL